LKPSLIGGFKGSGEWIQLAEKQNIGWWITSALESNIGLNAIAQWTYTLKNKMPQGLGTGSLFTNNFESPLEVKKEYLFYNTNKKWNFNLM
jgi:O-succinylbenzoate synthase